MTFPSFYQAERVGTHFAPDTLAAVLAGQSADVPPAERDEQRIALLLIDMQVDFIHVDGALSVPGAIADTRRVIEFIFRNLPHITTIAASLDSHLPLQIFSPAWWVNGAGAHPAPYTVISAAEVANGTWMPLYDVAWSHEYVERLEETAKKQLMIWPYHTLMGTLGHQLVPSLYEAIAYHSAARRTQPVLLHKGSTPYTEHYSIFEPEVKRPNYPDLLNHEFLALLAGYDRIYIAGEAKSHCVLESLNSVMRNYPPEVIAKLRVLRDCMSSVQHPQIDFDALAEAAFTQHAAHGLRFVHSTDPLDLS